MWNVKQIICNFSHWIYLELCLQGCVCFILQILNISLVGMIKFSIAAGSCQESDSKSIHKSDSWGQHISGLFISPNV